MKTKLFGKKIENIYEVDHKWKQIEDKNGEMKTVYTSKPEINKNQKIAEWTEFLGYDGEPHYNSKTESAGFFGWASYKTVNISESESVSIEEEIFRADLNEMHLHTNKVLETVDVDMEEALDICKCQIKAFNKMMIESNSKLMAYCDLHKLVYEDTDAIELFKLVFPDEEYVIEDGVMKVKPKVKVVYADANLYGSLCIDNATVLSGTTIACNSHTHDCISTITTTK